MGSEDSEMVATGMTAIEVRGLKAGYGSTPILHGVDLAVAPGEFIAILGSSGCGKTTFLRAIAGFQQITAGAISLFGKDVAGLPPEKRGVAMVFQSYALWPHMTVEGNIGYGLRLRGDGKAQIKAKVEDLLTLLSLEGLADRKVTNLSGGQRQRVALGRALAVDPKLLLLDEPLSNLDAKVRLSLRYELKALQKKLGFAAIHVTHDREEAMTMADRIVLMDKGRIAQIGPPEEVYDKPVSPFVASFMGAENQIALTVAVDGGAPRLATADGGEWTPCPEIQLRGAVTGFFRDDAVSLVAPDTRPADALVLQGRIATRAYPGGLYRYAVDCAEGRYTATSPQSHEPGERIGLCLPLSKLHLFSAQTPASTH